MFGGYFIGSSCHVCLPMIKLHTFVTPLGFAQDIMSDVYCHSENILFNYGDVSGEVHAGMMEAARRLSAVLLGRTEKALHERPGYSLRLVGHRYGVLC